MDDDPADQVANDREARAADAWLTSATLLGRFRAGSNDGQAWARLDAKYRPLIVARLRARAVQEADAEDLASNLLLYLRSYLPRYEYDPARKFRYLVMRAVVAAMKNGHRTRRRRPGDFGRGGDGASDALDLTGVAEAISTELDRDYAVQQAAERALGRLKGLEAEAVRLKVFEGREPAALARELGMEQAAIYRAGYRYAGLVREELRITRPDLKIPERRRRAR